MHKDYACEVDWARKWAEGIGQSMEYAILSGKKPALLLLYVGPEDDNFISRAGRVCKHLQITFLVYDTKTRTFTTKRVEK